MSDNAVSILSKAALGIAGIAAMTVIALFYKGDAAVLIGTVLTASGTFWGAIHSQQTRDAAEETGKTIAVDNKASNLLMESKVVAVAEHVEKKADEVVAAVAESKA
jgi:hypothetical protein